MKKTLTQIFKETKVMSQSDLARLLSVHRSTISRRAVCWDTDENGKILLHSKDTLIGLSEVMDKKLDSYDWHANAPGMDEFMLLYRTVCDEATRLIWGE
mgnify:CR=1 FL=1